MQVTHTFKGQTAVTDFSTGEIVIGRANPQSPPDLDLSVDESVSRRHARIWWRDDSYWIEDLGSSYGTFVNDVRLEYRRQLRPEDIVRIGTTTLCVQPSPAEGERSTRLSTSPDTVQQIDDEVPTVPEVDSSAPPPETGSEDIEFSSSLSADAPTLIPVQAEETSFQKRLSLLFDLPLQFAAETRLEPLLQLIVERVVAVIPGAKRGALLLRDSASGKYRLKAHLPPGQPAVSETLVRRAVAEGHGFIWRRGEEMDPTVSMKHLEIETGMYAPLRWKDQTLGVLCVDNPERNTLFVEADLQFLLAIAHYAASAVANHELQSQLETKSRVLERLLTNFSPKLRARLLEKALNGKLRPGGEKSEVTILMSDIRGFTNTSAQMDAEDVVELLNDYFPPLVQAVFQHNGTIDKFVGDAILAVFGGPEADPHQHENAVFAALAMQDAMKRVTLRRKESGQVTCEIGIGIHCGQVVHGFIGGADLLEFTVIGDAVNKSARYCDKAPGGQILISPQVFEHAFRSFLAEPTSIETKHEGNLPAYFIKGPKH